MHINAANSRRAAATNKSLGFFSKAKHGKSKLETQNRKQTRRQRDKVGEQHSDWLPGAGKRHI